MIQREDGPVKHYRMVCNSCRKRTKRFAYEFHFQRDAPPGWREDGEPGRREHYCPKCNGVVVQSGPKEVVPNIGDSEDMSDHGLVYLALTRKAVNELVVTLDGRQWTITSNTAIKVEEIPS